MIVAVHNSKSSSSAGARCINPPARESSRDELKSASSDKSRLVKREDMGGTGEFKGVDWSRAGKHDFSGSNMSANKIWLDAYRDLAGSMQCLGKPFKGNHGNVICESKEKVLESSNYLSFISATS